jgi:hypothetical protein
LFFGIPICSVKKQPNNATNGLINGPIFVAISFYGQTIIGIYGIMKKNIKLKNGNNLNAILAFENINENRYEYPISANMKKNKANIKYPI